MLDWQDGVCSARCDIRFPVSRTLSEVTAQFVHASSRSGLELLGCSDAQEGHHTPLDTLTQNAKIFADAIVRLCT